MARSFLVSEAAMEKRLVRAKYKIKAATIPYRVPSAADLPGRIRAVLSVLYLIYNTGVDDPERGVLRSEASQLSCGIGPQPQGLRHSRRTTCAAPTYRSSSTPAPTRRRSKRWSDTKA